ncbi:carboxymuconolactone decarboxylase family protein [Bacillus cereus]|uniref:carboxymuconolactone decarboxylase family protein n=1 Tax=Bacillus TaxID=1386 RepID=UPI000676B840|nr:MULTISPECIES: carboxymuconolactone decarboxylase family protein [Bacillus cereus group]MCU7392771.1 carboxymuconolactone decarboxylase family protein [Bacillus sp. ST24]AKR39040.1 Carboxymuconolactone decarboxylase [Bacillus thuringiensis serovar indiana]EKS7845773.1 carboxymuconolactone decarboxylase family protein [Bacillus cereus]MBG9645787.1 carboxymuconolactone decarboxylase [Bacillus thuringiensis]MBG9653099.1 carboxymuconolactone decarboxylase [Bacillus thuringiensis]
MNDRVESNIPQKMREMAPDFVDYSENILFERIWRDPTLTSRERSLCTLSALISIGNTEQLPFHLQLAEKNGISEKEIIALITHMAFYVGWPKAASLLNIIIK